MAHNPLLGNRISLISKKDIRYEGTLYSINEADATVALANVKSYGTEGREQKNSTMFVPPMLEVFNYLVFRGCDIKDLHVHDTTTNSPNSASEETCVDETTTTTPNTADAYVASSTTYTAPAVEEKTATTTTTQVANENSKSQKSSSPRPSTIANTSAIPNTASNPVIATNASNRNTAAAVGTGASLLHRKVRGATNASSSVDNKSKQDEEFDFQTCTTKFEKEAAKGEVASSAEQQQQHYTKDDFFDTISCDALDKQAGRGNFSQLRGAAERNLNTETFGASSLVGYQQQRRNNNNNRRATTNNNRSTRGGRSAGGGGGGNGGGVETTATTTIRGQQQQRGNKRNYYNNKSRTATTATPHPKQQLPLRVSPE